MSDRGRLAGKAAIVTGGASGIGEVTAQVLAREGASVCVADVNAKDGKRVADQVKADGGEAIFVRTEVGKSAQVVRMFERTEKAFGRLDLVHNNAIWYKNGRATELDEKDWDRTLEVGLKTIFLTPNDILANITLLKTGLYILLYKNVTRAVFMSFFVFQFF